MSLLVSILYLYILIQAEGFPTYLCCIQQQGDLRLYI
jgi:hypothetical protein